MKVTDLRVQVFKYRSRIGRDSEGHTHPGPEHDATQTLVTVVTDGGAEGYTLGGNPKMLTEVAKPALVGEDPFDRERIWQRLRQWQRLHVGSFSDHDICAVDLALWDLAGRHLKMPVHKLLGGFREKVAAYASTMCGDELKGGLDTPEAYANYAEACVAKGYKAFKLHTWMPPIPWAPSPKQDVAACAVVRRRVGPDIALMLDCFHDYDRQQALYIGQELEKLGYHWIEEPMDEHSISSYAWLAEQLDMPVVGPETAEGHIQTRAEWIVRKASDISRAGVGDLGGITPVMKAVHLAEAFGVRLPRNAQGQSEFGSRIERAELEPGDLVFYDTLKRPFSHVGIYVGDGRFVHAPKSGAKVRVERMESRYWNGRFNGARRIATSL